MANTSAYDAAQPSTSSPRVACPICDKWFSIDQIEEHAEECLSRSSSRSDSPILVSEAVSTSRPLSSNQNKDQKRHFSIFDPSPAPKRSRIEGSQIVTSSPTAQPRPEIISNLDTDEEEKVEKESKQVAKTSSSQNATRQQYRRMWWTQPCHLQNESVHLRSRISSGKSRLSDGTRFSARCSRRAPYRA